MKITFTTEERHALPEEMGAKLDAENSIELSTLSELSDEFESVAGLKSALAKERDAAHKATKDCKELRGKLADAGDPEELALAQDRVKTLTFDLEKSQTENAKLKDDVLTGKVAEAIGEHKGAVDLLTPHVKAALDKEPDGMRREPSSKRVAATINHSPWH